MSRTAFRLVIPNVRIPEIGFVTIRNNPNTQPQTVRFQLKDYAEAGDDVLKKGNPNKRGKGVFNVIIKVLMKPKKLPWRAVHELFFDR